MAKKRTTVERESDLIVIAKLYRRGWNLRKISAELTKQRNYSVSHVTIKNDLDEIFKRWKEQQSEEYDNFIVLKLEEIRALKLEAWNEYLRSKQPTRIIKETKKVLSPGEQINSEKEEDEIDELFQVTTQKKDAVEFTDLSKFSVVEITQNLSVSDKIGNPRFLEIVSKLIEQEARLLGFYKEERTENNSLIIVTSPEPVPKKWFIPSNE